MSCCGTGSGRGMAHQHRNGHGSDDCCDDGCCCGSGGFRRRFMSAREEREMLERYRDDLRLELEGLEERLKELGA